MHSPVGLSANQILISLVNLQRISSSWMKKQSCVCLKKLERPIIKRLSSVNGQSLSETISNYKNSGAQRSQRPEELRKSKEIYTQIDFFNVKDMTEKNYPPIRVVNSRHPFQRLYSAWNDKFSNRSSLDRQNKVLEEIQLFELNGTKPDPGYTVTFNAFAEFVASVNREAYHNRHWQRNSSSY